MVGRNFHRETLTSQITVRRLYSRPFPVYLQESSIRNFSLLCFTAEAEANSAVLVCYDAQFGFAIGKVPIALNAISYYTVFLLSRDQCDSHFICQSYCDRYQ